jgi:hypothetical protein
MRNDIRSLNAVRYTASAVCVLLVAGILILMLLARGKTGDEGDIAGVVAPALLLACASGSVAVVADVLRRRAQKRVMRP